MLHSTSHSTGRVHGLSTALQASDADYRLVIVNDCCADLDDALHTCLLEKLFPGRAAILSSSEFVEAMTQVMSARGGFLDHLS